MNINLQTPLIETGKLPGQPIHSNLLTPLPTDTPFGNLLLKQFKIIDRIDRINVLLDSVFEVYRNGKHPIKTPHTVLPIEEIVYHVRRVTDELICFYDLLCYKIRKGKYKNKVQIDSIGKFLNRETVLQKSPFAKHKKTLESLNKISNAYKHSFIHSDLNLVGADEPIVNALELKNNHLNNEYQYHEIPLKGLIEDFNALYKDVNSWLKEVGKQVWPNYPLTQL